MSDLMRKRRAFLARRRAAQLRWERRTAASKAAIERIYRDVLHGDRVRRKHWTEFWKGYESC